MEDFFGILVVIVLLFGVIVGIATGIDYMSQKNTVTRICIEIDWHSPTCEKLKTDKLHP